MNITDELREWLKSLYTPNSATVKDEGERIADRIDAEHEKACDDAWDNGYEADYLGIEKWLTEHPQVMEHHGWIRLPKDADGEYIRIGDELRDDWNEKNQGEVEWLMLDRNGWWFRLNNSVERFYANEFHEWRHSHHHAPTVEDVLREFANEVYADADNEIRDRDFLCAKYAKRLTLASNEE